MKTKNLTPQQTLWLAQREKRALQTRRQVAVVPAAPTVAEALADGLIPTKELGDGVTVTVPLWTPLRPGDIVHLFLNEKEVVTQPLPTVPTAPVDLTIPASYFLNSGPQSITYTTEARTGVISEISDPFVAMVDLVPPNFGQAPGQLTFDNEVEATKTITKEYLDTHTEVTATVPGYPDMAVGDVVTLVYLEMPFTKTFTVTAADVTNKFITVGFPSDEIRLLPEGQMALGYHLTDRAGNVGDRATFRAINLVLSAMPSNLQNADVPLFDDDTGTKVIDLPDTLEGVIVEIPKFDNGKINDQVVVKWDGQIVDTKPLIDPTNGFPMYFPVPRKLIIDQGDGTKAVTYSVYRGSFENKGPSRNVVVNTAGPGPVDPDPETPENEDLAAPATSSPTSGDANKIVPGDKNKDAIATVEIYTNAKEGEIITLYWGAVDNEHLAGTHTLTQDEIDASDDIEITVPAALIASTGNNKALKLQYTISHPAGTEPANPSLSMPQAVEVLINKPGGDIGLIAATFPDVNQHGFLVQPALGKNGVNVYVPGYEGMALNDTITLKWIVNSDADDLGTDIPKTAYTDNKKVTVAELAANRIEFNVPYLYVQPLEDDSANGYGWGTGKVDYSVEQLGDVFDSDETGMVNIDVFQPS